ncbi:hypothetical protein [Methanobrevibacter sp.]|uniref:hypothetical protein n=1 Tax=Methanobrevibacter sp. TaxID=66852 RepID=UPI003890B4D3
MMIDRDGAIALAISFFLPGLGIAYIGDYKKALIIFAVALATHFISIYSFAFSIINFIVWAYGMYATYQMVNY